LPDITDELRMGYIGKVHLLVFVSG